jgi:hypothetical protein
VRSRTFRRLNVATERAKRLLAAEAIGREHRTGDQGKLIREQLQEIMPELTRQFSANDLKPNSPIKPLGVTQTLFNAAAEGAMYNAELALGFGADGRADLGTALVGLADAAAAEIAPMATFGPDPGEAE